MAWIELPSRNAPDVEYIRTEHISVLGYPTRSNDGRYTIKLVVSGTVVAPIFDTFEECQAYHTQLKTTLGI